MTAVRPSEGRAFRLARRSLAVRALVALLCLTTAWVPWALVWGDALSDAGRAAQGEGRALAGAVTLPQVSGSTLTLFPGQANATAARLRRAFPRGCAGGSADYSALFGNDLGVVNAGRAAQRDLVTRGLADRHGLPDAARHGRSLPPRHGERSPLVADG